jgi:hypothetical protein
VGERPARAWAGRSVAVSGSIDGSMRTSSAVGSSACTSSRRPARGASRTKTRSHAVAVAPASSSASVPCTVRSGVAAVIGTSRTWPRCPGVTSTIETDDAFSASPKSIASGLPL